MTDYIPILIVAYLLGSIPFGLMLTRAAGLGDIRQIGSGNIGATNVMRTGHKWLGIATLLLDGLKGYMAVWLAVQMGARDEALYIVAMTAVLGHVFPVWLQFKGGKGVATAFGVLFALNPTVGLITGLVWLAGFLATRYASVASIGSFWALALVPLFLSDWTGFAFCLALAVLITYTHRGNIKRLREGTEQRFRKGKA